MRIDTLAQGLRKSGVGLHLAVAFEVGRVARQRSPRLRILSGAGRFARTEIRMRQQRAFGSMPKRGWLGRQHGHLGDLLGRRIDGHMGVGQEDDAALGDKHQASQAEMSLMPGAGR
jgi:hypothetical protein